MKSPYPFLMMCLAASVSLCACQADLDGPTPGPGTGFSTGDGTGSVDPDDGFDDEGNPTGDGSNTDTGFPNDPTNPNAPDVGGVVLEGDTPVAGDGTDFRFVCTRSARWTSGATTEIGANGLVGDSLSGLLLSIGGSSVTDLLNSVHDQDLAIDGTLRTASIFTLSASLLGTDVDSIDQSVILPSAIAAGRYAVFAVSFPAGLVNLGVLTSVTVTTYLGEGATPQEDPVTFDATALDLLGAGITGPVYAFIGRRVTQPYDRATVSLAADALAVDIGEAMFVHEMCTDGLIVPAL